MRRASTPVLAIRLITLAAIAAILLWVTDSKADTLPPVSICSGDKAGCVRMYPATAEKQADGSATILGDYKDVDLPGQVTRAKVTVRGCGKNMGTFSIDGTKFFPWVKGGSIWGDDVAGATCFFNGYR